MTTTLADHFISFMDGVKNAQILDIGCGDRQYEKHIDATNNYVGLDVEVSGRKEEDKIADIYYDGVNIPFQDSSIDIIICTQVLEHVQNPEGLVDEMYRVLKKDGLMYITVPFFWGEHEVPYDFRRYTSYGIKKLFLNQGFEVIEYQKLDLGADCLHKVLFSEINHALPKIASFKVKIKIFIIYKFFNLGFRLLKSTLNLSRVHLDNMIILKK